MNPVFACAPAAAHLAPKSCWRALPRDLPDQLAAARSRGSDPAGFPRSRRHAGGNGECRIHDWLPEVRWQPGTSNFWWWLDPNATLGLSVAAPEHGLMDHITLADATWHYHGVFPGAGRAVIACRRDGGAILIDDEETWNGRLIATTLDPFYHHGSFFMPTATRFLDGFLPWLRAGAPNRTKCWARR